jgi:polyhydroxyalkanoate synthase
MERARHFSEQSTQTNTNVYQNFDRWLHASIGKVTLGLSPTALLYAYTDWAMHLVMSPSKRFDLYESAIKKVERLTFYTLQSLFNPNVNCCIEPLPQDHRFDDEKWSEWPYNYMYQSFLLNQQWWHVATTNVRGMTPHHSDVVSFATRQILDLFSPSNFILTNPVIMSQTLEEGGMNLVRGLENWLEDKNNELRDLPPTGAENFVVGKDVAVTKGKVVYRNELIELIQYSPTTKTVHPEPLLIVPAWIMKYYILDLSPENSLVKYMLSKGHTIFMISWKNPGFELRDKGLDDYRRLGVMRALEVINKICGGEKVHGVGYCLGGTILSIAAAAMAGKGDHRFKSLTFLASQMDYAEAGELMLFIDESQVTFLEDLMWDRGYLDSKQMSGAFQLLRSKDLIYSHVINDYLLGKRRPMIDLMAWNADATRLPYRMHSEYLRNLFLNNDLSAGRFDIDDRPVVLSDIKAPIFSVATTKDHVSPWRSVYKLHLLTDCDLTFLLTTGGHNAGIISEPEHKNRQYQVATRFDNDKYIDPDIWQSQTEIHKGSWWPNWQEWIKEKSGKRATPPPMGNKEAGIYPMEDAPGIYVMNRS